MVSGYVLIPVQKGINAVGGWARDKADNLEDLKKVRSENQALQEQVAELTLENNALLQERYELEELKNLYQLDKDYSSQTRLQPMLSGKDSGKLDFICLS